MAEDITPLPPPDPPPSSVCREAPSDPPANGRPLVLQLDSTRDTVEDLHCIFGVISRHPGNTPVHLCVRSTAGERIHLTAAESCNVATDVALLADLQPWLET